MTTTVEDLCAACWNGDLSEVKKLLEIIQSNVINVKNSRGQTALYCASRKGHEEIIRLLLSLPNIDCNVKENNGSTALHAASFNPFPPAVSLLLSAGADPKIKNNMDYTAEDEGHVSNNRVWAVYHQGGIPALFACGYPVMGNPLLDCPYEFKLKFDLFVYKETYWNTNLRLSDIVSWTSKKNNQKKNLMESKKKNIQKTAPKAIKDPAISESPDEVESLELEKPRKVTKPVLKRSSSLEIKLGHHKALFSSNGQNPTTISSSDNPDTSRESTSQECNHSESPHESSSPITSLEFRTSLDESNDLSIHLPASKSVPVLSYSNIPLDHSDSPKSPTLNSEHSQSEDTFPMENHNEQDIVPDSPSNGNPDTENSNSDKSRSISKWTFPEYGNDEIPKELSDHLIATNNTTTNKSLAKKNSLSRSKKSSIVDRKISKDIGKIIDPHEKKLFANSTPKKRVVRKIRYDKNLLLAYLSIQIKDKLTSDLTVFVKAPIKQHIHFLLNLRALRKYSKWLDKQLLEYISFVTDTIREKILASLREWEDLTNEFYKILRVVQKLDTSGHNIILEQSDPDEIVPPPPPAVSEVEIRSPTIKKKDKLLPAFSNIIQSIRKPFEKKREDRNNNNSAIVPEPKPNTLMIEDVSKYLREDGSIDATIFCRDFDIQISTNYNQLDALQVTIIHINLKTLNQTLKLLFDLNLTDIFQSPQMLKSLSGFKRRMISLKETLSDELSLLENHIQFVQTLLENIHLDSFSPNATVVSQYFRKHGEALEQAFSPKDDKIPTFPINVPFFLELRDSTMEISCETIYTQWKSEYLKILQTVQHQQEAVPKKWPQTLPNLSSYQGKPLLVARDQYDYAQILSSYHNYVSKMDNIKSEWTVALRSLYPGVKFAEQFDIFLNPGVVKEANFE